MEFVWRAKFGLVIVGLSFCAVFITVVPANAQRYASRMTAVDKKINFSIFGAYINPKDHETMDDSGMISGRLTYNFNENLEIGVEGGWTSFEDKELGIKYGKINAFPVMAIALLKYPIDMDAGRKLVPYMIGGVGVMIWDYREEPILKNAGFSVDTDTSFACKAGLGADLYVNSNTAIFIEGSYLWNDYDFYVPGVGGHQFDTDMAIFGGGLKVSF